MKSKPITTDAEAAAALSRGRIALQNLPLQNPEITMESVEIGVAPVPNEFGARIHKAFRSRSWEVEWLHAATKPGQLPAFRATHPEGFQIEFRPGRVMASAATDEALRALVFVAQKAGWKSVQLSGTKDARSKMEILCRAAGIKVKNPLAIESPGTLSPAVVDDAKGEPATDDPLYEPMYLDDPPPPATCSPVSKKTKERKKKTQKEREEIFRRVDDQIFKREPVSESISDKPYEFSLRDLLYTPKSLEWSCAGRDLYAFAREMAAKNLDRYFIKSPSNNQSAGGSDRFLFCMVCDRRIDPERLRMADGFPIRHPSQRLRTAVKNFYSELGEPPSELVAAWLENRQPKAAAKPRPGEHAAVPLEPEPS